MEEYSIDDTFSKVREKCICRDEEITTLLKLIVNGSENSIFIYGNTGTGKTFTIKTIFEFLQLPYSIINCVEGFLPKLIYEKILEDLYCTDSRSCSTMMDFIINVKSSPMVKANKPCYIVFDKAERLRKMSDHILAAFLRISELTGLNISTIFITDIIMEKFFTGTGFFMPLPIHFNDYSKADVTSIIELDCPSDFSTEFYHSYCQLLVDVFYMVCRDVKELRHLAAVNFSKYCEPVLSGEIQEGEVRKLYQRMIPYLKKASQTVYLREVSNKDWENMDSVGKVEKLQVDLPYYAKYLLMAAYFASYNPAYTDRRFFVKKAFGKMTKRTKTQMKAAKNPDKKLLGPKPFQMDRLMAIFYCIVPGGASSSGNILNQLSTLVSLNLLTKVSQDDVIEAAKYKCVVPLDFAIEVGKQVDLDIIQYLNDYT